MTEPGRILVTGGAGFIGSALVRYLIEHTPYEVLTLDKLTYAGDLRSLEGARASPRHRFVQADVCDSTALHRAISAFQPDVITHLAAESHVDRSIESPTAFIQTNVVGTFTLLSEALAYWVGLKGGRRDRFRFHHISTDEVFGSLDGHGLFTERSPYDPRSPYSASKASSDHLVQAWHHTYGLPVLVTNCSNNYGPYQFPDKLIPVIIAKCLAGEPLPIYGNGLNVRDWLFVEDHVRALVGVFEKGRVGERYLIGGRSERTNIDVANTICTSLDRLRPRHDGKSYTTQMSFVADRPGHDKRYAIDPSKIESQLGWRAEHDFTNGIEKTVRWHLDNEAWWRERRSATMPSGAGSAPRDDQT